MVACTSLGFPSSAQSSASRRGCTLGHPSPRQQTTRVPRRAALAKGHSSSSMTNSSSCALRHGQRQKGGTVTVVALANAPTPGAPSPRPCLTEHRRREQQQQRSGRPGAARRQEVWRTVAFGHKHSIVVGAAGMRRQARLRGAGWMMSSPMATGRGCNTCHASFSVLRRSARTPRRCSRYRSRHLQTGRRYASWRGAQQPMCSQASRTSAQPQGREQCRRSLRQRPPNRASLRASS